MGKELPQAQVVSLDEARAKRGSVGLTPSSRLPLKFGTPNFVYHHWDEEGDHKKSGRSEVRQKTFRTEYSI